MERKKPPQLRDKVVFLDRYKHTSVFISTVERGLEYTYATYGRNRTPIRILHFPDNDDLFFFYKGGFHNPNLDFYRKAIIIPGKISLASTEISKFGLIRAPDADKGACVLVPRSLDEIALLYGYDCQVDPPIPSRDTRNRVAEMVVGAGTYQLEECFTDEVSSYDMAVLEEGIRNSEVFFIEILCLMQYEP